MSTTELNRPLFSLTVGEFLELQKKAEQPVIIDTTTGETEKYVYGLAGLAGLFGCSRTTAGKIKASGKIDKAISQMGQKIIINADLAVELLKISKNRRKA